MKKIISLIIVFVTVFGLSGCAFFEIFDDNSDVVDLGEGESYVRWNLVENDNEYSTVESAYFEFNSESFKYYEDGALKKEGTHRITYSGVENTSETSDYSGWVYDTGVYGDGLDGLTFTIHSSSARGTVITLESGSITIELQRNGHTGITNLDFSNADLPIASASVESDGTTWTYTPPVTPGVPEPATATLSLLALAGLAARRRRRG